MPTYTFECSKCGEFDVMLPLKKAGQKKLMCPDCKFMAKKVITAPAVQCDSIQDVPWLPSAVNSLMPEGKEKEITTRAEYNSYLKKKGIAERG